MKIDIAINIENATPNEISIYNLIFFSCIVLGQVPQNILLLKLRYESICQQEKFLYNIWYAGYDFMESQIDVGGSSLVSVHW